MEAASRRMSEPLFKLIGEGESEETGVIGGPVPNSGDGIPDGPGWFY